MGNKKQSKQREKAIYFPFVRILHQVMLFFHAVYQKNVISYPSNITQYSLYLAFNTLKHDLPLFY